MFCPPLTREGKNLVEPESRGNLLAGREFDLVRAVRRQLAALHGSAVADFRPGQD